ncbi:MAG: helix-turn-helix transcriptional regulator [Pseudomonadota bacterium]
MADQMIDIADAGANLEGIAIDAGRVKAIRRARKIGRPKLAKLSGISERQVAKIENTCSPFLSQELLHRFSRVLRVPKAVLTGEDAPIDDDLRQLPAGKTGCSCCS